MTKFVDAIYLIGPDFGNDMPGKHLFDLQCKLVLWFIYGGNIGLGSVKLFSFCALFSPFSEL